MQFLYEIFPVFAFFITFKLYGIYVATTVGMVTTILQVLLTRIFTAQWEKKQVITMCVFIIFGGMTLYFHNPIFVKWKPTIVFWIFSLVLILSQIFTPRPLMRRMMESSLQGQTIPSSVWRRVNAMWALFFVLMGSINLYIAYYFNNDVWVNFKFYGITVALIAASIIQAVYLFRHLVEKKAS